MGRCWLKVSDGDAMHWVMCAVGFNIWWLLRVLTLLGLAASCWTSPSCRHGSPQRTGRAPRSLGPRGTAASIAEESGSYLRCRHASLVGPSFAGPTLQDARGADRAIGSCAYQQIARHCSPFWRTLRVDRRCGHGLEVALCSLRWLPQKDGIECRSLGGCRRRQSTAKKLRNRRWTA